MSLRSKAYLEIIEPNATNATFELARDLEIDSGVDKKYVMAERGQYLREIWSQLADVEEFSEERRTGFYIDGGAGVWSLTLSFLSGEENVQWGDGSGGSGTSNITEKDATGADVSAIVRQQVMQYWIARTRSDSSGLTVLHWGEWTDGNIAHISGVSAGAYNQPMPLAIQNTQFTGPETSGQDVASFSGTIEADHVDIWGGENAPAWADDASGAISRIAEEMPDA